MKLKLYDVLKLLMAVFLFALFTNVVINKSFAKEFNTDILQMGKDGSSADKEIRLGSTRLIRSNETSGKLEFSNDGAVFKKIGAGEGGGVGIASLDNPGFEDGITSEWTCTSGKCSEETTDPLVGEKSLKFDPTTQNDEFVSTLKAIPEGLKGVACEARVYYTGGDENLTAQVVNGDAEVIAELVLQSHSIASYESIFFLCPTKAEIIADSDKGDLQIKVYNETVTAAATSTFDEMYNGNLIGLFETTLPDTCNFIYDMITETITSNNNACPVITASTPSTGHAKFILESGFYTVTPASQCSPSNAGGTNDGIRCSGGDATYGRSPTLVTYLVTDETDTLKNTSILQVQISKQGADAKQSVQVYKSIPKVSDNVNFYSGFYDVSANSFVAENTDWIASTTHNATGDYTLNFNTDLVDNPLICNCSTAGAVRSYCTVSISNSTKIELMVTESAGSAIDRDVFVHCNKQGTDFKMPIVQPILVNQVETKRESGVTVEVCRIINSGTATTAGVACDDWVDSVTRTSQGLVTIDIKTGIFNIAAPVCTATSYGNYIIGLTGGVSPTQMSTTTLSDSGALTDRNFWIQCTGAR